MLCELSDQCVCASGGRRSASRRALRLGADARLAWQAAAGRGALAYEYDPERQVPASRVDPLAHAAGLQPTPASLRNWTRSVNGVCTTYGAGAAQAASKCAVSPPVKSPISASDVRFDQTFVNYGLKK